MRLICERWLVGGETEGGTRIPGLYIPQRVADPESEGGLGTTKARGWYHDRVNSISRISVTNLTDKDYKYRSTPVARRD